MGVGISNCLMTVRASQNFPRFRNISGGSSNERLRATTRRNPRTVTLQVGWLEWAGLLKRQRNGSLSLLQAVSGIVRNYRTYLTVVELLRERIMPGELEALLNAGGLVD